MIRNRLALAMSLAALITSLLDGGAEAGTPLKYKTKTSAAMAYSHGGDYDTIIGPKAQILKVGAVALNPQPEPPGVAVSINPQPLPPRM